MGNKNVAIPIENYKLLGCAIIEMAVRDYWDGNMSTKEFRDFMYETLWIKCLKLDIDNIYDRAVKEREKQDAKKK